MLAAVLAPVHARADTREVVIGYQDMVVPWRCAQASGAVEKATGYKVTYRKLGSGADVIRAVASGSIQVGEARSSPIVAGLSQGVVLSMFWILDNINDAEALVARNGSGVSKLTDLKGKTLGVPYVSTSHFHALVALHQAGADPSTVKIVNLRPEVAAAWERGNIDATYIWDPALAKTKQSEKVLITSGEVAKESGKATFDGFVAPRKFAQDNPAFLNGFVRGARRYRCAIPRSQGRLDRRIETGAGGRAGIRRGRRRRSRILMGVSRIARGVLDPPLEFYRPLPPLAYLPLVVIYFGIDETAKIVVIWLACFAPIAMAARAGMKSATHRAGERGVVARRELPAGRVARRAARDTDGPAHRRGLRVDHARRRRDGRRQHRPRADGAQRIEVSAHRRGRDGHRADRRDCVDLRLRHARAGAAAGAVEGALERARVIRYALTPTTARRMTGWPPLDESEVTDRRNRQAGAPVTHDREVDYAERNRRYLRRFARRISRPAYADMKTPTSKAATPSDSSAVSVKEIRRDTTAPRRSPS